METGRVLWLVIATIMILGFSQARYIVKDKSIEDNNKAAVTGDTFKLEINKQKVEDDASIMTTYDQILIVYESTVENDETMTDDDNITVVNEQSVEDEHETATTDDGVLRTPKTIKNTIVSSLADLSHKPESPTADKETARTDRSNIPRSKTRHMIRKRDLHQWETLLYGWS
ncbi:uncharacterized protein LOC110463532 isoform X1 [Mizuhopecten yessoensis]|uniref:Uncharacterized protein n=1 Tax=Mizuhopecten yessoensis TaxID=6573 RepID=A0A210PVW3_MIZYE|nr:uncharacterized protein LOC110463532 isoform X1 [Mizuhopecten yessoensis]OWF40638.1 hypothetical protein KP79_PYT02265 [Mizuhopecten yessoensis]